MPNLYICAIDDKDTLSYYQDWRDAFKEADFHIVNLRTASKLDLALLATQSLFGCDWIVLGHSSYYKLSGATRYYLGRLLPKLKARKVLFLDNEYREFRAKLDFAASIDASVIVSQFPQDVADKFYGPHTKAKVLSLAHGLNPQAFLPGPPISQRRIDLGFRSYDFAYYLGDRDRYNANRFAESLAGVPGFIADISTDPGKRYPRSEWAAFLQSCKMTIASEAGSGYIEYDDRTRWAVDSYQEANPGVGFDEVFQRFFKNYQAPLSGKIISPRHFEAAGTRTCQVLVRGRYNDILSPDVHYIPLQPDLSNGDEVTERVRDPKELETIADRAYRHILEGHTYGHRLEDFMAFLRTV